MSTQIQTCYRHTDRRAGVICQRCDRPICPDCMRQASVGFHCPECTKAGAQKIVRPAQLLRPVVTQVLVAVNVAVFAYGFTQPVDQTILDGGLVGRAVAEGEWYRIVTSGFLHAGLLHIGFNMYLLYQLGMLIEPALGRLRFGLVYAVALLSGSLGVLLISPDALTVGASGAVFGLMGAGVAVMRSRGIDPFSTGLGGMIVLNLIITFTLSRYISVGGHVGGLIGGFLAAWILTEVGPRYLRDSAVATAVVAAIGVALVGACLVVA